MRAEGGPSCPSSNMVPFFSFSSLYYTDIKYSSTGKPPSTPSIRARSRGLWACCGHHRLSTIPQAPKSSVCAHFWRLWAFSGPVPLPSLSTTPGTLEIKRSHLISGVTILQPPKSSGCAHFQWLWALSIRRYHHNSPL